MNYAIIETGGKQYRVSPGNTIQVERISQEKGAQITLDKVLAIVKEDHHIYGSPYVHGAKVIASVEDQGKARKIMVYKQKPRKGFRKLRGHRQPYTSLKIQEIVLEE